MKKIVLLAMAFCAVTFTACKKEKVEKNEVVATDSLAAAGEDVDAAIENLKSKVENKDAEGLQASLAEFQTKYAQWLQEGKVDQAKEYAAKVQAYLKENAEAIKSVVGDNATVNNVIESVANMPLDIANKAADAANTVSEKVDEKTNEAIEKGKETVNQKVDEAKEQARQKAAEGVKKANEEVNKAADKALKGLGL